MCCHTIRLGQVMLGALESDEALILSFMASLQHCQCARLHSINGGVMYDELGRFQEEMSIV